MAVDMFKSLIFDGKDSRDFGIYITGTGVFNAPVRAVDMVTIPGRDGAFAIDQGRFDNIEVSYPAGIYANTEKEFAEAISNFRNFLCSRSGYCRLEDEYNPDEFRLAVYKSGLEVDPVKLKAGKFNIVFDCKPQRFLKSGEQAVDVMLLHDIQTVEGDNVYIDNKDLIYSISEVEVDVVARRQSGTPSVEDPKNIYAPTGDSALYMLVIEGRPIYETLSSEFGRSIAGGNIKMLSGKLTETHGFFEFNGEDEPWRLYEQDDLQIWSIDTTVGYPWKEVMPGLKSGELSTELMFNMFTGSTSYEVGTAFIDENGELMCVFEKNYWADRSWREYLAEHPLQVVYPLETPKSYDVTPATFDYEVDIEGYRFWSEIRETVRVSYGVKDAIVNPTMFASHPLLNPKGYGSIQLGNYLVEIEEDDLGVVLLQNSRTEYLVPKAGSSYVTKKYKFSPTNFNIGDEINYGSVGIQLSVHINPPQSGTIDSVSGTQVLYFTKNTDGSVDVRLQDRTHIGTVAAGQTLSEHTNFEFTYTNNGSSLTGQVYGIIGVSPDTDNSQVFDISVVSQIESYYILNAEISTDDITVNSSVQVGGDSVYIDLELGEAYMIDNGNIISLNSKVNLGSHLMELKPGANKFEFSYKIVDSERVPTITSLKITPRWWKI